MEWYRDDLDEHQSRDPYPKLIKELVSFGVSDKEIKSIQETKALVKADYQRALKQEDPRPEDLTNFIFAPTPITQEKGERESSSEKNLLLWLILPLPFGSLCLAIKIVFYMVRM